MSTDKSAISGEALPNLFASAVEYLVDTGQRSVLFLDVMRQRGIQYREHIAETAPHVLNYSVELIVDGRTLERPVNYGLVRVAPPRGVEIDNQAPSVRGDRSARRPRAGDRRLQGGQRDRRGDESRSPLLLHRLPARPDARPDDRGHREGRGGLCRKGHRHASGRRRQTVRDRQLPGRLGGYDPGLAAARAVRAAHHRRRAVVLLGRRPRQEPDALFRWAAGRKLADGGYQRSRRRQVRRCMAGPELREHESLEHAVDQAVQRLFQGRYGGGSVSRVRTLVGRTCQSERRGDPVHRR